MGDNSMYWPDQQPSWSYQQQIAPQQPLPPPPPPYAINSYSHPNQVLANDQATPTPPPPQQQQHQHPPPPPPQTHPHSHPHHHQQQIQHHHQHQLVPNGLSNGSPHPHQQANQSQPGHNVPQQQQQMNHHYNSHLTNLHHEPPNNSMHPQHQLDPSNYQMQQQQQQQQAYQTPNQQQQQQHQPPPPPPPASMYAQSTAYPGMIPTQTGQSMHHSAMQQQPHQSSYPTQQYSPPSYWNSVPPMHGQQTNYGPQSASQGHIQNVSTPPSADNTGAYHAVNNAPPHAPPPSNMPYESRGPNMSANYSSPYPNQPAPSYYNPHEVQPPPPPPPDPYELPPSHQPHPPQQQQPPAPPPPSSATNPQSWSNGYYQPNQAPYQGPPNMYSMPYNGSSAAPSQPPPVAQPPQHIQHPQYHHHQPQQPQQWPAQNHIIPTLERNKSTDKKPVKPRAPKKQSNPNAPSGRRKRLHMTEEHKQSGYAAFYQEQRKTLPKNLEFGEVSTIISDRWNLLSLDERNQYVKGVSVKRKEMLKKKASQQAQDLLVQGTKQEPDLVREMKQQSDLIQGLKKEVN